MNKIPLHCVLGLAWMAGAPAHAQSSVTIFGIADAAVRQVKNADATVRSLAAGGYNSSRLGFRGEEDLGGGLKASFWLEHGFSPDTGATADATRFWNRRSTVSMIGAYGELRLGRDFTPAYRGVNEYDAFNGSGVGAVDKFLSLLGSNADTGTRSDNQVAYYSPGTLGGAYAQLAAAPSEGVAGKRYTSGRLGYASKGLDASVSFADTSVATSASGADKYQIRQLGVLYDFGIVKSMGFISRREFGTQRIVVAQVGVHVPVGGTTLRASYTRADASGSTPTGVSTEANDAHQLALGAVYDFSKRTALYGTYSQLTNRGAASFAVATPPAQEAGRKSRGYELGIRHRF